MEPRSLYARFKTFTQLEQVSSVAGDGERVLWGGLFGHGREEIAIVPAEYLEAFEKNWKEREPSIELRSEPIRDDQDLSARSPEALIVKRAPLSKDEGLLGERREGA